MIPFSLVYNRFPFLYLVDMYKLYNKHYSLKNNDIMEKFFNPL